MHMVCIMMKKTTFFLSICSQCYISGAVSRFFRPEPTNIITDDPNSFQESAVDSGPANFGRTEGDASRKEVEEEQPLATDSVLSSSRPVVSWELCTTDTDVGPDEESMQNKTQLSRGSESKTSDEGEGTREEQFAQRVNEDAGLVIAEEAKEDKHEENRVQKLYTHGQDETQENDEYEEPVNTRSLRLTGDAMSESGGKAGAEEESERAMTPDNHHGKDETMTKIKVAEEEDKMHREDEPDLNAEDGEVELCTIMALSLEEEDNVHVREKKVQRDEADTSPTQKEVDDSDGVLLLASENENESDEGARQVENQLLACKELADDESDFKGPPSFTLLHVDSQGARDKSGNMSEDELVIVVQERVRAHRSESDKVEDAEEKEVEREQGAVTEEENVNEQDDDAKSVSEEESQDISTGHVACSEELVQNAKTELHTVVFADGEQEDVTVDPKVQTKTRDDVEAEGKGEAIDEKSYITTTDISIDERFFDKDQVEEEKLSSEIGGKECSMEAACTATSVTVKSEGENGQETSGEFTNIPLGICEGRLVVSQELNSPAWEEAQGGVPEHNNEPGQDENTTQRFLEIRDSKESQTIELPEKVESKELESLQNSGCCSGDEYLLVRERMEEEQESTDDIKNSFDLVVEEHTGILCLTEAGLPQARETPLVESAIQELSVDSTKTEIEHSEKEFEMQIGLTHLTDKITKELQDGTEQLLVEFEIDECDFKEAGAAGDDHEITDAAAAEEVVGFADATLKFLEAEVQKMTEMSFFVEPVDAINVEQNSYRTPSLLENVSESGFMKQSVETEPQLFEASSVEMQDAEIHMEKPGYRVEEEAAKDETQNKNEKEILNLRVAGIAAELTRERGEKEKTLFAESEALETQNQLSDEALEISNEETEAESKTKDMSVISAEEMAKHVTESDAIYIEETVSQISGFQDVIDEEILDLWIQAALSEDTDGIKQQEGPEPGQQMDRKIDPLNEEQDEISFVLTENNKEQLVESNSGESEFVSDTEMSSSTAESIFLDQSLCELGAQNSETQLMTSTSTGSFQGIYDMLVNMSESADISELSIQQPNSESQDILMEEAAETGQSYLKEEESDTETGFHPTSGDTSSETRHLNQELDESRGKTGQETGSTTEIGVEVTDLVRKMDWKVTEEADVQSLTERGTLFKVEDTIVEELLEMTVSDSADEIEHTGSRQSRSGSEASLEEGIVTESGSQGDTCTESKTLLKLSLTDKPQPGWSDDHVGSLPELNRTEVAEQLTTEYGDQMEVFFFIFNHNNVLLKHK